MGELEGNLQGNLQGRDPSRLRISDADRHEVAEVLREAAGEGRLDLDELDERLEATWAARTYTDLVPITIDLPTRDQVATPLPTPTAALPTTGPRHETSLAIMGGQDRVGVWVVPPTHNAFALMGGITLDLRQAIFTTREVVINASAVMGGVDVVVNAHTRVSVDGVGIMGSFEEGRSRVVPQHDQDSPLVRVRGLALMGAVTVTRKQVAGEPRPKRRPRLAMPPTHHPLHPPQHRHPPGH